jgi:SSS family solute:Na+ symporter
VRLGHPFGHRTQLGHCTFELHLAVEATFWVVLFQQIAVCFQMGSDQLYVQRLHSTRSRREMYKSMFGGFLFLLMFSLISIPAAWGFVAYYELNPEFAAGIVHPDQVLPDFVVRNLPVVFRSLIMASVLAALMSSLDSAINSTSNVFISDFYRRFLVREATDRQLVRAARVMSAVFGIVVLAFSLWQFDHQGDTGMEKVRKLTNVIAAPLPAFFLLGIFSKRVNTPGVVIGALAGVGFAIVFNGIPGVMDPVLDWIN